MEILQIVALFSVIYTTFACGCGGCNYASDLACARCCTAYVKRATAFHAPILQRQQNLAPHVDTDLQLDALLSKHNQFASIISKELNNGRSRTSTSSNMRESTDNNKEALDLISASSAWRRLMNGQLPNVESATEVYNYLNSMKSANDRVSATEHLRKTSTQEESGANSLQRELAALQAIVQQLYNGNGR